MSTKHTSGDWIVDEVNTPNGKSYMVNHLWRAENDGDGPETRTDEIAEVVMDYADPEVPLANARLLAASPRMEAALMLILVSVQQGLDAADVERIKQECQIALSRAWGVKRDEVGTPDLASIQWATDAALPKSWYCVTRENELGESEPSYRAHGPYDLQSEAQAFDDAVEMVSVSDLESLGTFLAASEEEAIDLAKKEYNYAESDAENSNG